MVAIVGLHCARQRVAAEVCSNAGFEKSEQIYIACVADRVGADAERAAVQSVEALFDIRLRSVAVLWLRPHIKLDDQAPPGIGLLYCRDSVART